MTGFIDTHSHLNDKAYCEDAHEAINRALKAGVFKILLPDIDSTERDSLFSMCDKYKNVLYPMLGLYPESVNSEWQKEIDLMLEKSYTTIGGVLKEYEKEKNIEIKIDLYKCLRNFVQESSNLKKYEKIKFAEDIYLNSSKENVNLIVEYLINLVKRDKNLKEKLEYKKMLRYPVNIKLLLINLIMSI